MSILRPDLPEVNSKNSLSSFFPVRTKDRKGTFDWEAILGYVVKLTYNRDLHDADIESFKQQCKNRFEEKLDEEDFWPIVEKMYFENDQIFKISPELLLFKAQKQAGGSGNERIGKLFNSLLEDYTFEQEPNNKLNFLEREITDVFNSFLFTGKTKGTVVKKANEHAYLPFISQSFQQDLEFLRKRPKYLLNNFKDFLKLYAFLYTAQLTLNLKDWHSGTPVAKPCYFIMDNEKASDERAMVKNFGYAPFARGIGSLFPYLAMNEALQDPKSKLQPIWKLAEILEAEPGSLNVLNGYAQNFKLNRDLTTHIEDATNITDAIKNLLKLAEAQFSLGETRFEINTQYKRAVVSELCDHFVQLRGRAGRVLVFNQDYIVLLTNLAIGENDKLRLHELLKAFESRGVFFDKQSQQVLIEFYERIGNVERMSDSGDAVYVRKTV